MSEESVGTEGAECKGVLFQCDSDQEVGKMRNKKFLTVSTEVMDISVEQLHRKE